VNDNLNYLDDWFEAPQKGLDIEDGWHEYGSCIFNRYLTQKYGEDIVRKIWERMNYDSIFDLFTGNEKAIIAIQNILKEKNTNLKDIFADFTVKNYNKTWYREGSTWPDIHIEETSTLTDSAPTVSEKTVTIDHLASTYIKYVANQAIKRTLRIKVECPDGKDVSAMLILKK
jgi:hypothetical protein